MLLDLTGLLEKFVSSSQYIFEPVLNLESKVLMTLIFYLDDANYSHCFGYSVTVCSTEIRSRQRQPSLVKIPQNKFVIRFYIAQMVRYPFTL